MERPERTSVGALGAVAVAVLFALVGMASAGAHSALESTSPAAGSQVADSPDAIILQFTEPVELGLGGVRVFDSQRNLVSSGQGAETSGDGSLVSVPVEPLPDEAYVVTWRVTSADSHPVSGAFTFTVGDGAFSGDPDALVDELLAADGGSELAGGLYALDRALVFVGLAALVGLWCYVAFVHRASFGHRRTAPLLWVAWAVMVVASALSIGLQGVTASGVGLGDITDTSLWSAVLDTRFGQVAAVRLGLLVLAAPLLVVCGSRRGGRTTSDTSEPPAWWQATAVILAIGLCLTVAWAGHAGSGRFVGLAMSLDVAHLAAMAVWLGGLVGVVVLLLPSGRPEELRIVVPRFSTIAFACVVTLVVTGSVQAWRQLGSLDALTSTTYGRVLAVKLAIVAVLVILAARSRSIVRRTYRPPAPVATESVAPGRDERDERRRLGRSVLVEVALGVAVLVVTALLVNLPPGIDAEEAPWAGRLPADDLTVDVTIDPAVAGPADVHVFILDEVGVPVDVVGVTVELSLPSDGIEPLEIPVEVAGRGHFSALGYEIPFDGDWDLAVVVRVTDFEEVEAESVVPIG